MFGLKRNPVFWLTAPVIFLCVALPVAAQNNTSFQYFYDDLGQLTKVVDSSGTMVEYVYDPVGNILQIKRASVAPGTLAIFNFTPQRGGPGQTVTIQGQGFGVTTAGNNVQFNGALATVLSASATTLTVTVPDGATTGPISVTVSGQTVTSVGNFTVLPLPVITSLSRKSALLGDAFPNARFPGLTVTGINLTGSTFAFAPATAPPAITVGPITIDAAGTSASMSLTVGTKATGTFALVATNNAGSSSAVPTKANRFTVVDPHSFADTDGDGVPDAIEAIFGTDPLDPNSVPILASSAGQAESPAFTMLNKNASRTPSTFQAESPSFTVLNTSAQPPGKRTLQVESPAFTVLNGSVPPTVKTFQAESPAFTVLNSNDQPVTKSTLQAESPAFTVQNTNASRSGPQTFLAESSMFSVLNGSPLTHLFAVESPFFSVKNTSIAAGPNPAEGGTVAHLKSGPKLVRKGLRAAKPKSATKGRKPAVVSTVLSPQQMAIPASGTTTTQLNDQQGVMHDNQHK